MNYKVITINSIIEFEQCLFSNFWIFRGQSQDWKIKSSIERLFDELNYNYFWYMYDLPEINKSIRQEFIDLFKEKTGLKNIQALHCLSLMQHHGLKTELLDVTENIDVALYFGCCDDYNNDGVIWAFNKMQLYLCNVLNGFIKNTNSLKSDEIRLDYSSKNITQKGLVSNIICSANLHDYQKINNLRIERQQGLFLLAPNFWKNNFCYGTEKAIFSSYGLKKNEYIKCECKNISSECQNDKLIKFIIPANLKQECLNYLENKGITKQYLFPSKNQDIEIVRICEKILSNFKTRENMQRY